MDPFVKKLKDVIATFISKFLDLTREYQRVKDQLWRARNDNEKLANRNRALQKESDELKLIKGELGSEQYEEILDIAYQRIEDEEQRQEQARQSKQKNHKWEMSLTMIALILHIRYCATNGTRTGTEKQPPVWLHWDRIIKLGGHANMVIAINQQLRIAWQAKVARFVRGIKLFPESTIL